MRRHVWNRIAPRWQAEPGLRSLGTCRPESGHRGRTRRPPTSRLAIALCIGLVAVPASARPVVDAGAGVIQRESQWGYRVQAGLAVPQTDLRLDGEWSQDATVTSYAGTGRYRFGLGWLGISPLAGWRGQVGGAGITGPEVGLGLDLSFSPDVPSLQADGSAVIGLNGAVNPHLRLTSRYRVLTWLDLQASYRLEQWASWTQVWGVGASLVL